MTATLAYIGKDWRHAACSPKFTLVKTERARSPKFALWGPKRPSPRGHHAPGGKVPSPGPVRGHFPWDIVRYAAQFSHFLNLLHNSEVISVYNLLKYLSEVGL